MYMHGLPYYSQRVKKVKSVQSNMLEERSNKWRIIKKVPSAFASAIRNVINFFVDLFPCGQQFPKKSKARVGSNLRLCARKRDLRFFRLLIFPIVAIVISLFFVVQKRNNELIFVAESIVQVIEQQTVNSNEQITNSIVELLKQYTSPEILSSNAYVSTGTLINTILQASYLIVVAYQEKRSFGIYPYELAEYAGNTKIASFVRIVSIVLIGVANLLSVVGCHSLAIVICSINYGNIIIMLYLQHATYDRNTYAKIAREYYQDLFVYNTQKWVTDMTYLFQSVYQKESKGNTADKAEYEFVHNQLYETAASCIQKQASNTLRQAWVIVFRKYVEIVTKDNGYIYLDRFKYFLHQPVRDVHVIAWIDLILIEVLDKGDDKQWSAHAVMGYFLYTTMQTNENSLFLMYLRQHIDEIINKQCNQSSLLDCFVQNGEKQLSPSSEFNALVDMVNQTLQYGKEKSNASNA